MTIKSVDVDKAAQDEAAPNAGEFRLAEEASKFTLVHSELMAGINKILKFITYLMIPAGLLIIYNQLFSSGESLGPALSGISFPSPR